VIRNLCLAIVFSAVSLVWGQGSGVRIGGAQPDEVTALARDASGAVYAVGTTHSPGLESAGGGLSRRSGQHLYPGDVFVQKMTEGGEVVWRAVFGGSHRDQAAAVAVDASGSVYITGTTLSLDFPMSDGAFRSTDRSEHYWKGDAFVVKLSPDGGQLVYSTLYGGDEADEGTAIAIDSQGQAVVAGITFSDDLLTTGQTIRPKVCGGFGYDGFVAKLSPAGDRLVFGTYICGSGHDRVRALALGPGDAIYLAGETRSEDFPVSDSAAQKEPGGEWDGFVMKLWEWAHEIAWSTRLGGARTERIAALALLPDGRVAVGGETWTEAGGLQDGFVSLLAEYGHEVFWTVRVGGAAQDAVTSLAFNGEALMAGGWTRSKEWLGEERPQGGEDGFVAQVALWGGLEAAIPVGGALRDQVKALAADANGWIAAGQTGRADWLTEDEGGGQGDGFVLWSGTSGTAASFVTSGRKPPAGRVADRGPGGRIPFEGTAADPSRRWLLELRAAPGGKRETAREAVRDGQRALRTRIQQRGGRVYGAVDAIANVLFTEMNPEQADEARQWPEVKRVLPVRQWSLDLDGALQVHRVIQAWEGAGGEAEAGRGIRIGIMDTGVDVNHPALAPGGLEMPEGFPRGNSEADLAFTSNKVIVARGYAPFDAPSAEAFRDHGTGVAITAAGNWVETSLGWVLGVAPQAWIGSYNVFPPEGSAWDEWILIALEDAVLDGMDLVNMSLGSAGELLHPEDDIFSDVAERMAALGTIIVKSSGNDGPTWGSLGAANFGDSALRVGNHLHRRKLVSMLDVAGSKYQVAPGDHIDATVDPPVSAPLADLAARYPTHWGCEDVQAGIFSGRIVLVDRGGCTFALKALNIARGGAVGMLVANYQGQEAFSMSMGTNPALPAGMISGDDGARLRQQIRGALVPLAAIMNWPFESVELQGDAMNSGSSGGPSTDGGIAPDLSAIGTDVWAGKIGGGYQPWTGTSFSAPLVSGALGVLKGARPGLSTEYYRSLLINTARPLRDSKDGVALPLNRQGAGSLTLDAALQSQVTAFPATVSFGRVGRTADAARTVTLSNLDPDPLSCTAAVEPSRGAAATAAPESVELAGGGVAELAIRMSGENLQPGQHEGYVRLNCGEQHPAVRIPYWMGVTTGMPAGMMRTALTASGKAGRTLSSAARFRIWDEAGLPINDHAPVVTVEEGTGAVTGFWVTAVVWPGQYAIHVRPGPGRNVFRVRFGDLSETFEVQGEP
jgi:minor extracellular serine protease Vpr